MKVERKGDEILIGLSAYVEVGKIQTLLVNLKYEEFQRGPAQLKKTHNL
jgi:hypothetical protein